MIRGSLLGRLYTGTIALILLLAVLVATLVAPRVERASLGDVEISLRNDAAILRELALPHLLEASQGDRAAAEALRFRVASLADQVHARLTVVDIEGNVVAETDEDPATMENHGQRPEILQARADGTGQATRTSPTLGIRMMYLAYPVQHEGALLGFVRVALPLDTIAERLRQIRLTVLLATAFVAVVALLAGYWIARRITRPLRSMTKAVRSMARGDYDEPLRLETADENEIATLAVAFNTMRDRLRNHLETIEQDRNKTLAILGSMREGVVAVDHEERVVHMNEAAGDMLAVDAAACHGHRVWEAVRTPQVCDAIRGALEGLQGPMQEMRIHGEGTDRYVELESSILRSAEGKLTGAVLVLHDITELRRLEGVRSDFVSNVSHELKTPVAAIRGLTESILDDPEMPEATRLHFLERVRKQSSRLSNLVSDLLSLSSLEARQLAEHELVDLTRILRLAVSGQTAAAEAKGLTVNSSHPSASDEPTRVLGEEESLRQVFDNLLSNAIRYTPERGTIWVRSFVEAEWAVVEVQDTGIGIEPQHRERIFERFYRADKARSRELGGTGLGLAIVKHIILNLAGEVSVDSVPGEGSTFRVRIPRVRAGQASPS